MCCLQKKQRGFGKTNKNTKYLSVVVLLLCHQLRGDGELPYAAVFKEDERCSVVIAVQRRKSNIPLTAGRMNGAASLG